MDTTSRAYTIGCCRKARSPCGLAGDDPAHNGLALIYRAAVTSLEAEQQSVTDVELPLFDSIVDLDTYYRHRGAVVEPDSHRVPEVVHVVAKAVCLGGDGGGGGGGDGFVVHVLNLTQNAFRSTRFLVFFRVHKRLNTHTHTHTHTHDHIRVIQ